MIFVFKTSVKTKMEAKNIGQHIDKLLPQVKWNFDLEDSDRILRVDCPEDIALTVIELLNSHNYCCEELK